jgi:hypothetical protein
VTGIIVRLRPLLIGLVVLLFTAGIAFASKPAAPTIAPTSPTSELAGQTVPVDVDDEDDDEDDDTRDVTTTVASTTTTEVAAESEDAEDDENCSTDPTGLTDEELAEVSHGSVVCWAAHQETPEGYRNHGAWVSEWAKKNHGHPPTAETAPTTTTPTAPATGTDAATLAVTAGAAADHPGKGRGRSH